MKLPYPTGGAALEKKQDGFKIALILETQHRFPVAEGGATSLKQAIIKANQAKISSPAG